MSTPSVSTPTPRNLTNELLQTYAGQSRTAQPYFNLESFFQPKYGQVQLGNLQQQLFGYNVPQTPTTGTGTPLTGTAGTQILNRRGQPSRAGGTLAGGLTDPYAGNVTPSQTPGYHPGTIALGTAANTLQRGADIGDVAQFGPAATSAFLQANPFLASGLTNLLTRTQDSPILQLLNRNAQTAIESGGALSPQEQRAADQQARESNAARGLLTSPAGSVAEILNRDALTRQRQAAAQQFGMGVQGLNQNQADLVGRAAQIFSTTLSDPFQAILGRPSGAGSGGAGGGYPQQIGTGARLFNPESPYAADIYNTNYNAQAAANVANANNQAATTNAGIGAGASILAAALPLIFASDERLKENIRGTGSKTPEGIPIKTFRYKTDPHRRKLVGVMAQDVEKVRPGAVVTDPITGAKAVDYSKIAAPFNFVTGEYRKAA
jgi:Chaperone of endosialidase